MMWNPFRTASPPPPQEPPIDFDVEVPSEPFVYRASGEWDLKATSGTAKLHWCDESGYVDLTAENQGGYSEIELRLSVAETVSLARALIEAAKRAEKR